MGNRLTTRDLSALAAFLVLCYGAGGLGGWLTSLSVSDWYPTLAKPPWTPPGTAIAIVWNVLFGLMGIAAWLVWRRAGLRGARAALALFGVQLVLNVGWSALFVPYALWVAFAGALTVAVWRLNA